MEVKIYNSLTNKLDVLKPIKPGEVSIYCCGPTVYNDAHIGNIRPVVVFDTLRKFLEYIGYNVKLVSNFTDVDDKIINKAIEEGSDEITISERYIKAYKDVISKLNVGPYYNNPKVTEYMDKIIKYIDELEQKGAAYCVDGDVYFRISSIQNYGQLSNIKIEDLLVGARIEKDSKKESPLDFVLWKKTDKGIQWDTKWSKGRPGWHTECCVMINSIFNGKIDIHGGGFDLKFPHHENEIAQAKAHDGHEIANIWMHNGFINFGEEKMSKSLGNVVLAKDAIKEFGGNVLRFLILSTQYRAPVSFTSEAVESVKNELARIQKAYNQLAVKIQLNHGSLNAKPDNLEKFLSALADDLNTSNAIACVFEELKNANNLLRSNPVDIAKIETSFANLKTMLSILGIQLNYSVLTSDLEVVYNKYLELKALKQFEESDKLRDVLIKNNIL